MIYFGHSVEIILAIV